MLSLYLLVNSTWNNFVLLLGHWTGFDFEREVDFGRYGVIFYASFAPWGSIPCNLMEFIAIGSDSLSSSSPSSSSLSSSWSHTDQINNIIKIAKTPNGDKITSQSAEFQQFGPASKGLATSISLAGSYRKQAPLKSIYIFVLSFYVTYSNYRIAPSRLIHCSSSSWDRIDIYKNNTKQNH